MNVWHRFALLWRRKRLERVMDEEMEAHLIGLIDRNIANGMAPEEARFAARRSFGGLDQMKEQARDVWGWRWLDETWIDFRFALKMMRKTPGLTAFVVLTLALGLGTNATLFSIYNFVALRPLPSKNPEELVDIRGRNDAIRGTTDPRFSYPDFLDYGAESQTFSSIAAVTESRMQLVESSSRQDALSAESEPKDVSVQAVSGNYFSTLGADVTLGRDFRPDEFANGAGIPVAIISDSFWRRHFNSDTDVLGKLLVLQNLRAEGRTAYTIIGVTAPHFVGQTVEIPAAWILLANRGRTPDERSRRSLSLIGRLNKHVSLAQAKADLDAITLRLAQRYPEERRARSVTLTPGMRIFDPTLSPGIAFVMMPVLLGFGLVLVISCLNVANLLLARGVARQHEIGVRLALGAGRTRIVRQLFAENFLLCILGAGAAVLFAWWTLQGLRPLLMTGLAGEPVAQAFVSQIEITIDHRIVGFAFVLAILAGLAAGLAPALHAVRRDGIFALKREGSAFGQTITPTRLRDYLLVGQVAGCLVMLVVSALMTVRLFSTRVSETGFASENVYQMTRSRTVTGANAWAGDLLNAVDVLGTFPGVVSSCLISEVPLRRPGGNLRSTLIHTNEKSRSSLNYDLVSPGFFETFGVPVQHGRLFTVQEENHDASVVVVSEAAARWLWPGQEAVGQVLSIDAAIFDRRKGSVKANSDQAFRDFEVIGVTRDFQSNWGGNDGNRLLMLPLPKNTPANIFVHLRADSPAMMRNLEEETTAAGLPLQCQDSLIEILEQSRWPFRAFAWVSGALTALALVLVTVGLYGVMSFAVNQRVVEIGVRMALGATAERITGQFLRHGARLVAIGIGIGVAGAAGFTSLLGKAWPGLHLTGDFVFKCEIFATGTALLSGIALVACWLPARRAASVDPMVALRCD